MFCEMSLIPVQQGLEDSNPPTDERDGETVPASELRIAQTDALRVNDSN